MKSTNLGKLIKKRTLSTLLAELELLAGAGVHLDLYDAAGAPLLSRSTPPPEGLEAALERAQRQLEAGETGSIPLPDGQARALVLDAEVVGLLWATTATTDSSERVDARLSAVAAVFQQFASQAKANRALAHETLERYREINLLYGIQEAIGTQLELDQIANLVLNESVRVIKARSGVILLCESASPNPIEPSSFVVQARLGQVAPTERYPRSDTIAGWVVQAGRAAIVNDVANDARCGPLDRPARSLLCAPLTVGDGQSPEGKVLGAITLYDKASGDIFTASDQKLLLALASQSAIAVETARAVQVREERLKQQIRQLRIEIDEIRKEREVAQITETDYFARLQSNAEQMRREFEEF